MRGVLPRSATPIRRSRLHEEVAARLEQSIQDGHWRPGDQLPSERDIADELGVGRSAVREALLSLRRAGLVTVSSGERARVTAPSARVLVDGMSGAARFLMAQTGGARQLQQARALFEIGLARLAAQCATADDIARLRQALAANRKAIGRQPDFQRTDVAFHYEIAAIPRNPVFTGVYQGIVEWLTEQRVVSGQAPQAGELAHAAHQRIFDAIAARDPEAAADAMEAHLDEVSRLYWAMQDQGEHAREAGG
ncbi:MAG TPA: FCD domain-containing protein [Acetobacteraceae bacterium]|nr:FCD domain-containing protein [Acetobacteraceae bacterium]